MITPTAHPAGENFAIEVEGLRRQLGGTTALDGVSVGIRAGEFFSLLGPSGCGKTTLLRILAGLDLPDAGVVRIGGQDAGEMPAHERPVNTVFQSYALFPHLTVAENVAFGLEMKRVPRAAISVRVERVMATTQITHLAHRKPAQLSGGQKQRVAVARAIVNEPKILLLDEPMGALDLKLRKELQIELLNLQRRLGITFVYVTHDQGEALVMSDRIAVMRAGRIEQMGRAGEIYQRPRTRFVAQFLGSCNLIEATVSRQPDGRLLGQTAFGPVTIELPPGEAVAGEAHKAALGIRPEHVQLVPAAETRAENRFTARLEQLIYHGSETRYFLRLGEQVIEACQLNASGAGETHRVGQELDLVFPPAALLVLAS